MTWFDAYDKDTRPTLGQMSAFTGSPLWDALNAYLVEAYDAKPKQAYSGCSGQPGWNVKYQKGGKSLVTLYPMPGFFIALVVIGAKEKTEAELLLPTMSPYTQALYAKSAEMMGQRWLMAEVRDRETLEDIKRLVAIRRPVKGQKISG